MMHIAHTHADINRTLSIAFNSSCVLKNLCTQTVQHSSLLLRTMGYIMFMLWKTKLAQQRGERKKCSKYLNALVAASTTHSLSRMKKNFTFVSFFLPIFVLFISFVLFVCRCCFCFPPSFSLIALCVPVDAFCSCHNMKFNCAAFHSLFQILMRCDQQ